MSATPVTNARLERAEDAVIDDRFKGIPGGTPPFRVGQAGSFGWNVLREDLPLPLAVLKDSALTHNISWFQRFLAESGAILAPHGKTTMSPQLFRLQLDAGAWAITLANVAQVQVARRFGVPRILLANQLVGRRSIDYVLEELRRDPGFEFFCLVDSLDGVRLLAEAARTKSLGRPVQVLLEGGIQGRRTGCRTLAQALEVARAVKLAAPHLTLRGVEGFEGILGGSNEIETEETVAGFLNFLMEIARACVAEDLFAPGPIILSAGGSGYYDMVVRTFAAAKFGRDYRVVIRSGCYLTQDSGLYDGLYRRLLARTPAARELGEGLKPALEVWAYVQSRPEPARILLSMGKRDCSHDSGMPKPLLWHRPGAAGPNAVPAGHSVIEFNDQHAFMDVPANSPLSVGDMIGFGISHPCLTFDKWQAIPIVDDAYNVVSMIRTYF